MDRVICPNCHAEVLPDGDGRCPNCHSVIPIESTGAIQPPEKFRYLTYWKVILLLQAGVWVVFGLFMLWVGFGFVFPSGGVIRFGGLGWLLFLVAPVALVLGIAQYRKATSYAVELSEKSIRVGGLRARWTDIENVEIRTAQEAGKTGEWDAVTLTTRDGNRLSISALTENLPRIKKYIETRVKKSPDIAPHSG